jgi:hypothetical protein
MSKIKAQLKHGLWPDGPAPAPLPVGLTVAARSLALAARDELSRFGVAVMLDEKTGKAQFCAVGIPSRDARLTIERHGDLIEAYLREAAP